MRLKRRAVSGVLLMLLASTSTLALNTQPVKADWTWTETIYIRVDGSIEPDTAPISTIGKIAYTLTDNIVGDIPENSNAIVIERDNIVVDGAGYTVRDTGVSVSTGIDLGNRNNVTLQNVEIINFGKHGIYLHHSNNNTLTNNTISDNFNGIHLNSSSNSNIITRNTVSSNDNYGIFVYDYSNDNVITGNTVSNNFNGIHLQFSSNNLLTDNIVFSNNWHGISVTSSSNNNVISGNNISTNQDRGINFHYSYDNNFTGNTISNNGAGIYVFYFSSNNNFFHNNLLNNTVQAYAELNVNTWDNGYPFGGNYWSDYAGADADDDGIGDIPHIIDENNQDSYPLIYPWSSVERKAGVEVGNWAKYSDFNVAWSSNDPDSDMPMGIALLKETEWWENSVEDILDTKIRYQQLLHFKNGSEYMTTVWIDVDTGSGTPVSFVSSGLGPSDCLYTSAPWFTWKVNKTTSRMYAGVNRESSQLNITTSMQLGPPPAYPNTTGIFYWDRETGVLCELSMKHLNQTGSYTTSWSVSYVIADTNLWEAPIPTTIGELETEIEELDSEGEITNQGTVKSLIAKLNVAQKLVDKGKTDDAKTILSDDFIPQVQKLTSIHITVEAADILVKSAEYIISQL